MTVFLVDEDLPRSLAPSLREAGFACQDVRDVGLGGRSDIEIIRYARSIVLIRFRQAITTRDLNSTIIAALARLAPAQLSGAITVIEPGRVRVRRRR